MNILHYKDLLLKEQEKLIEAMQTIGQLGQMGGDAKGHWETHIDPDVNKDTREDELTLKYEEETTNEGVLDTLEERLKEITDALARIDNGTYGVCQKCGKKIEEPRLEANPAATTCLACA
jgi:RNA polymerase-binding transcription factor DksA